ncbi:HAD family hydrolase [Brevibacillus sp. FIR094]|uniref:HAD family hydrolase n=1 Tax=Brevibacillus sp. FIR094 TaxID=3134809 RepID=UPI003D21EF80
MPDLLVNNKRYTVKAILFDKDGTLLEFVRLWGYWSESVHRHFASQLPQPAQIAPLAELWGTVHDEDGHVCDYSINGPLAMGSTGDLLAILAWQGYRQGLTWGESMRLARECKERAYQDMEQTRPAYPIPGLIPFLDQCRDQGMFMGIVTADETEEAIKHIEWMGIRSYFPVIIGNDQVERGKPYPDMVVKACTQLGLKPREVAVIGDTSGDIRMGKSAGVSVTIGIVSKEDSSDRIQILEEAEAVISSYTQLKVEASRHE